MLKDTLYDTLYATTRDLPEPLLSKTYFFHDIRVVCQTNHPAIFSIFDKMLGFFPEPAKLLGEAAYCILCSEHAAQFPY